MSADAERARLEAIVFGRPGVVSDAEVAAAASMLERMQAEARAAADPPASIVVERPARPKPVRRWPLVLGGALAIAALVAAGAVIGTPETDSMAIFDRPQTDEDRAAPGILTSFNAVQQGTVRYVGSAIGFDVYVYRLPREGDIPGVTTQTACMAITTADLVIVSQCVGIDDFSDGVEVRVPSMGDGETVYQALAWSIQSGVTVSDVDNRAALDVFDAVQLQDDLLALDRLGEVADASRPTVRWLGASDGLAVAGYRLTGGICIGVFEQVPLKVGTPSVKGCVTEADFAVTGVTVLYPNDDPRFSVTWGPTSAVTVEELE